MRHKVQLVEEDIVDLILPDGRIVNIEYYSEGDDSLPVLDIELPALMAANCYAEHLEPAPRLDRTGEHVRVAKQIVIPIERAV
jgi:hypothetical protein